MGTFGLLPYQDGILKAKAAAAKAIELDNNSSEAHVALSWVLLFGDWDWNGAQQEIFRALELNPSSALAHSVYVHYLWAMGNKEETLAESRKVKELDPLNPASSAGLGWYLVWTSRDDLAEREFREALKLDPNTILAHVGLAEIYSHRKLYDQAAAERFAGFSHSSSDPPALATEFMNIYRKGGYPAANRFVLEHNLKNARDEERLGQPSTCDLGVAYADLGDSKNALYWMEKGLDEHCREMMDLKSMPRFDFLRNQPRFHALLQRMKLESAK
jgi:tetratricopeptide (TPR) repeat protein